MRSSHEMVQMKAAKIIAIIAILAIAVAPILAIDGSDATVNRVGQAESYGFTDNDEGTLKIVLKNTDADPVTITLKVFDAGTTTDEYCAKEIEVPGSGDNDGETTAELKWKFSSSGTKYVDVVAYDTDGNKIDNPLLNESSVEIEVSHSIWKNTATYIVIAIIVIIVIVIIVLFIRSGKKTKADSTMADRTFTKMHDEKVARKKTASAKKEDYKSSSDKPKRKSK